MLENNNTINNKIVLEIPKSGFQTNSSPDKLCARCKLIKPRNNFYSEPSRKDGLKVYCKSCVKNINKNCKYKPTPEQIKNFPSYKKKCSGKEAFRERMRKWRDKNPEKLKIQRNRNRIKRKSIELTAIGAFTVNEIKNIYQKQQNKCACCDLELNGIYEIDHILPLSRDGSNFADNIQLLTPFCNRSKGAKTMEDYMQTKNGGKV